MPAEDEHGFITDRDSCGISTGHTPDLATHYMVRWDTNPSMSSGKYYEMPMIAGDDEPLTCCPNDKCHIDIGTEVQRITINSNSHSPIRNGHIKVVYVVKHTW